MAMETKPVKQKKTIVLPTECHTPNNHDLLDIYAKDMGCTNLTKNTIQNYRSCLKEFAAYFQHKSLLDIDIEDLKQYKLHLEGKTTRYKNHYAPATISRYFTSLESLYQFLEFDDYIEKNPLPKFRTRYLREYKKKHHRNGQSRRKLISVEDMSRLIHSILDPRDKAVALLLAKTGIRRQELVRIDLEDINWVEQSIHLKPTPKRTNLRIIFDDECTRVLKRWLISRENRQNKGTNALFLNERGGRLGRNAIYELIVKYATKVGIHNPSSHRIQDRFTPHNMRHWNTTWLLRNGMKREYVKELRGDAPTEAIDIYHHIDPKELKDAYLACIPQLGIY